MAPPNRPTRPVSPGFRTYPDTTVFFFLMEPYILLQIPDRYGKRGDKEKGRETPWFTPLFLASQSSHVNPTRLPVKQGVDAATQDKDGSTPLHQASQNGHLERTLVLLEEGADANCRDTNDVTPLHLASRFGHLEIVRALLTHGAYASPQDESDCTPLHFASEEGRVEIVRLLLDHNKDNGTLPISSEHEDPC